QTQAFKPPPALVKDGLLRPEYFPPSSDPRQNFSGSEAEYASASGQKLFAEVIRFRTDSEAYSLLTLVARRMNSSAINLGEPGTASTHESRVVAFFKGPTFVRVTDENGNNFGAALDFA